MYLFQQSSRDYLHEIEVTPKWHELALLEDMDLERNLDNYVRAFEDHQRGMEEALQLITMWLTEHDTVASLDDSFNKTDYLQILFDEAAFDPIWSMYVVRDYFDHQAERMLSEWL